MQRSHLCHSQLFTPLSISGPLSWSPVCFLGRLYLCPSQLGFHFQFLLQYPAPAPLPHHSLGGSCTEGPADPPGKFEELRPESPGRPRYYTPCLWGSGCSLFVPTPLHTSLFLVSAALSSPLLNPCRPPYLFLSTCTAFHLVSLHFHLSLSALHLTPCLTHWDMLLTGAQTLCGSPYPVICAPLPQL